MAARVPRGIERPGSLRSPERPTPAAMPVKAGKTMAKTMTKGSPLEMLAVRLMPPGSAPSRGVPSKKDTSESSSAITTT